jgi:WD40 repeat protein
MNIWGQIELPFGVIELKDGPYGPMVFSPDSKKLARGGSKFSVYKVEDGSRVFQRNEYSTHIYSINNNTFFLGYDDDREIKILNTENNGIQAYTISQIDQDATQNSNINDILIPLTKLHSNPDNQITIFDPIRSTAKVLKLKDYTRIFSFLMSKDNKILYAGAFEEEDGSGRTNTVRKINSYDYNNGLKLLNKISVEENELIYTDVTNGKEKTVETEEFKIHDISSNGNEILCADDGYIMVVDIDKEKVTQIIKGENTRKDGKYKIFPISDASYLRFNSTNKYIIGGSDNQIKFWKKDTGELIHKIKLDLPKDEYMSFAQSPNGKYLAVAYGDKINVYLIDDLFLIYDNYSLFKDKIPELFKPKDEFESRTDYNERVRNTNKKKDELVLEILKQNENKNSDIIKKSKKEIVFNVAELVSYNANDEVYLIKIGTELYNLNISKEDAKQLKENVNNVKVTGFEQLNKELDKTEFIDLILIHPVTKKNYSLEKVIK